MAILAYIAAILTMAQEATALANQIGTTVSETDAAKQVADLQAAHAARLQALADFDKAADAPDEGGGA